jgi:hypothetical protein
MCKIVDPNPFQETSYFEDSVQVLRETQELQYPFKISLPNLLISPRPQTAPSEK